MRNLKRALSLGLTAAMISGLMVMGSSAASYADVTSEDNVEAIEVLQTVGIMVGDENGDFNPDQNVTRNEMAVVMSNLMEYNVASYKDTSPFTDVPSWAEPYVAACWTNGITAGYSDTIYGGSDTVTTAQAALMLMKALGYFQYSSDFGADWQLATVKQGNAIDLFVGVDSGVTQAMTRNDVAQLVLNTLKSGTVEASTDGSWTIGDVTINNNVTYSYITSNQTYATAIDDARSTSNNSDAQRSIVELGEQLYMGDLKLNDDTYDVFGRPARYWEYEGAEIGTYAKTELLKQQYTTEVTGKDLYDLLGKTTIDEYGLSVTIDGVSDPDINGALFDKSAMVRTNDDTVGDTGDGVLTQVYVDTNERQIDIAIINTYLALADDDFDDRTNDLSVTVYGIEEFNNTDQYVKTADADDRTDESDDFKISAEDFPLVEEMVDGDALLVTVADGEVQSAEVPEVLSGVEISTFKLNGYVITDGTRYDFADSTEYEMETLYNYTTIDGATNLKDLTYDIYLDQYGYAIGVVEVEKVNNYLFITGVDTSAYNRYDTKADATAIFLDGTIQPIEIDLTKVDAATRAVLTDHPTGASLVNSWFTYTVNKNDLYTVDWVGTYADFANKAKAAQARSYNFDTAVGAENDGGTATNDIEEISKEAIVLRGGAAAGDPWYNVYGNDESIYITAEVSKITAADTGKDAGVISDVLNVTVGVDNANIDVWTKGQAKANAEEGPVAADPHGKVSNGVYTLFDDDGYVIAAVVVGEDAGTTTNLVYAHTGNLESESYDKNTEEYTWVRKVISDGKEIEITEVGDSLSELKSMSKYNWYEVKYLADGTVKSVELAASALYDVVSPDEYVDVIDDLDAAMAEHKVVLYEASDYREATHVDKDLTSQPSVEGRTFYVDTTAQKGFRVDDDVQIVFIQTNNNKETVSYESGYQRLEKVIDRLHDSDRGVGTYNFEVSAIMDNYGASVVVIRDLNEAGATVIPPVGGVTLPDEISISTATMTVNVPVFIEDADKVNDLAREALQNAGYTVTGVKVNGTDTNGNTQYELTAAKDGVSGYVFETEATVYVTVSLDVDDAVKNNAYIEDVTLSDTVVPVGGSVTVTITKVGGGSFSGTFKSQSYESDGTTPISVEKTDTGASPLTFNYSDFTQNTIIRVYQ